MPHDLPLLSTLAVSLSLAFLLGLIATRLKLPPIIGYLFAGIMVGPYTRGYVADIEIAQELSEIGIVLLMFGVGLHFSVKDLMDVRRIAIPGAIVQIAVATALGAGVAHFWDWSLSAGLMFGLALSVASTVVLLRAFEERNMIETTNGRIAIGWLIVEDLVMVLALVLIPALAGVNLTGDGAAPQSPLVALAVAIGKVGLFVAVMMIGGRRLLPWLLMLVARTRSRELFTLAVFASAIGVAFLAAKLFDVSFALGAFFAGMMIRESDLNHEVAERSLPFQDAFAVLFFVSVGMLFNPMVLVHEWDAVLVTAAIILVGKAVAAMAIVMMFGYPLKTGLVVSAGLGQIGEFSFILVNLGLATQLLPPEARDLVLAGAMITIAFNPVAFKGAQLMYEYVARKPKLTRLFNMSDDDALSHLTNQEKQELKNLVILVGHGRVGRHVCQGIHEAHIDLVVIDNNRERVEGLRDQGYHAIVGDAGTTETMIEASIEKAVAVAIAVPDPFEARRIVEVARELNPGIKILVRAHNDEELTYFQHQNVDLALLEPREISRRMVDYLNGLRTA